MNKHLICRPFFSNFFGRANQALSSQFYRARRQNSEPGKKTILGGSLPKLCVGRAGVVRKYAKEHLDRRSNIKITCKCKKKKKNSVTDQQSNRWTNEWTDQQMERPTDRWTNRWTDQQIDRPLNIVGYRVVCKRLEKLNILLHYFIVIFTW